MQQEGFLPLSRPSILPLSCSICSSFPFPSYSFPSFVGYRSSEKRRQTNELQAPNFMLKIKEGGKSSTYSCRYCGKFSVLLASDQWGTSGWVGPRWSDTAQISASLPLHKTQSTGEQVRVRGQMCTRAGVRLTGLMLHCRWLSRLLVVQSKPLRWPSLRGKLYIHLGVHTHTHTQRYRNTLKQGH